MNVREVLIISGKGGTGKTSLAAAFAFLAEGAVMADCDVDASDLHLLLAPTLREKHIFRAGHEAVIRAKDCVGCGTCRRHCRFEALLREKTDDGRDVYMVDPLACEGCGVCVTVCPKKAIDFPEAECGAWFLSDTRVGPMAHARLHPGGENSGKLVSHVRKEAMRMAQETGRELVIIDGPPGTGCPVIASLGGVSLAVVVTEPTLSGEHDCARVLDLAKHFSVPAAVCINKWDINPEQAMRIETMVAARGAHFLGRIGYDHAMTQAQRAGKIILEMDQSTLATEVRAVWAHIKGML